MTPIGANLVFPFTLAEHEDDVIVVSVFCSALTLRRTPRYRWSIIVYGSITGLCPENKPTGIRVKDIGLSLPTLSTLSWQKIIVLRRHLKHSRNGHWHSGITEKWHKIKRFMPRDLHLSNIVSPRAPTRHCRPTPKIHSRDSANNNYLAK